MQHQHKNPRPRIKRSILVCASVGILGLAYAPERKPVPSSEFIDRVYARGTGIERWKASQDRKKEILARIREIRKRISLQAETYIDDRNGKKVKVYSVREKRMAHCYKLMSSIADNMCQQGFKIRKE